MSPLAVDGLEAVSETIFGAGDNICCVETRFDDIKYRMQNRAYFSMCLCTSMIYLKFRLDVDLRNRHGSGLGHRQW